MRCFLLFILLLLFHPIASVFADSSIRVDRGWQISTDDKRNAGGDDSWRDVDLPCISTFDVADWKISARVDLPEFKGRDPVIFIKMLDQPFDVLLDGREIYRFGELTSQRREFLGLPWHIIPLPENFQGKRLLFNVRKSADPKSGLCDEVFLGSRADHIAQMITKNIDIVVLTTVSFMVAFTNLIVAFSMRSWKPYVAFSMFAMAVGTWVFSNSSSQIKLFLINDPILWAWLDFTSLYLIPAFVLLFAYQVFGDYKGKGLLALSIIHFAYTVGASLLNFFGFIDPKSALFPYNCLVPITIIILAIYTVIFMNQKKENAGLIGIGLLLMIGFAIHDLMVGLQVLPWSKHTLQLGLTSMLIPFSIIVVRRLHQILDQQKEAEFGALRDRQRAEIIQMIAHDVRKPFTIMANTIDILANAKSEHVSHLANEFLPHVKRTLKEVSGLFDDIISIGDDKKLNISDQSVYSLIKESLTKNSFCDSNLELKYQLKHTNMLSVDISKATRIFNNIVENAVQAQKEGCIWFTSSENDKWIAIIVGNSGSFIPETERKKIFEMFFTKGKSKGTGLGLAIAERFVKLHGGKIECNSKENYGTEFMITLPKSNKVDTFEAMPSRLSESSIFVSKTIAKIEDSSYIELLGDKIVQSQPVRVLVLDDEVIYHKLLLELVPDKIRPFVVIDFCSNVVQARDFIKNESYDMIIIDFDLGKNEISGFDFLEEVKSGSFLKVMHTNRSESSFSKTSYEKGADYFLSKPMTRSHFVKFVYEASSRKNGISTDVVIVDDEPEHLLPAISLLKNKYKVITFESVDALLDELDREKSAVDLGKVSYIFVDRFIGKFDITKQNVPENLRKYGYQNKIVLFSNSVSEGSELPKGFDSMISKELSALKDLIGI